jgi:hypothetical protein
MHFDLKIGFSWVSKSTGAVGLELEETAVGEAGAGIGIGLTRSPESINRKTVAIKRIAARMS